MNENLQALYKEEFEKNKGKGFSAVADTPEMQRVKKTQDQISNVCSVHLKDHQESNSPITSPFIHYLSNYNKWSSFFFSLLL